MLLYEYQIRDEFSRVSDLATRILDRFQQDIPSEELLQSTELLGDAYDHLMRMLPDGVDAGNFKRHLRFMKYYLDIDAKPNCVADISDICKYDLPALENAFKEWCANHQHYDTEFAAEVGPLLKDRHLDSAIRKAFVVLKERMVRLYGINRAQDGRHLFNIVFGSTGWMADKIDSSEREAMRSILDGLYMTFRNPYDHENKIATWAEAEAVLTMINWVLLRLADYPSLADSGA